MALSSLDGATRLAAISEADQPTAADWHKLSGGYKFGKRPFKVHEENKRWNFLQADDGARPFQHERAGESKGIKFGAGFSRKQASAIGQDLERKAHEAAVEARRARVEEQRRQRLAQLDKRNGFDVIAGTFDPSKDEGSRAHVKYHGGRLSDFQKREGDVLLRVSESRFHRPAERDSSDPRQRQIATEGLVKSVRASSVLGSGRADMRSYGVADNFQYSLYDPEFRKPSPRDHPLPPGGTTLGASASTSTLPALRSSAGSLSSRVEASPPMTASSLRSAYSAASSVRSKPARDRTIGHIADTRSGARGAGGGAAGSSGLSSSRSSTVLSRSSHVRQAKRSQAKAAEISAVRSLS